MTRSVRRWLAVLATMSFTFAVGAANHTVQVGVDGTLAFSPATLTIRAGDTVTWVNANVGGSAHNVFADDGTFTSGSPTIGPWSYSRTFTFAGSFGYYCLPHGGPGTGEFGTIVVAEGIEIEHASDLADDLNRVADRYRIAQTPFSSYEVVVDPIAGNPRLELERISSGGALLQAGTPVSATLDMSQSLRWANGTASIVDSERVRVSNANCAAATCSINERYRLRAYETTLSIPRFNNSGAQLTVLILQNPSNASVTGTVYFWSPAGTLLNAGGQAITLAAKAALVLNTATVSGVSGQSGTITVAHNGRYGELTGKSVALEPSTGFSFDTPAIYRLK